MSLCLLYLLQRDNSSQIIKSNYKVNNNKIMTKQEKLNDIINAFVVHSTKDIYIYNEKINEETKKFLQDLQFNSGISFELSYKIANNACALFYDLKVEDLENEDFYQSANDTASVYTAERLSWLDINNQSEISEAQKEYNSDIETACAIWFEQKTAELAEKIKGFILED